MLITVFPVLRVGRGSLSGFTLQVLQRRRGAKGFAQHASEGQRRTTASVAHACLLPPRRRSHPASAPLAPPPPLTPAVFMTHSPGTLGDVSNQIRNGFMQVRDTPLRWFAGSMHAHACCRFLGWYGLHCGCGVFVLLDCVYAVLRACCIHSRCRPWLARPAGTPLSPAPPPPPAPASCVAEAPAPLHVRS